MKMKFIIFFKVNNIVIFLGYNKFKLERNIEK